MHLESVVDDTGYNNNSVQYLLNFAPKTQEVSILNHLNRLGTSKANVFFAEYVPDPFRGGANIEAHKSIFSKYILHV